MPFTRVKTPGLGVQFLRDKHVKNTYRIGLKKHVCFIRFSNFTIKYNEKRKKCEIYNLNKYVNIFYIAFSCTLPACFQSQSTKAFLSRTPRLLYIFSFVPCRRMTTQMTFKKKIYPTVRRQIIHIFFRSRPSNV